MNSDVQTARVVIDIDVGSEPISGAIELGGTGTQRFVGWTALAELLERARTGTPPNAAKTLAPEAVKGGGA
jgi:hypothetical protein